MTIEDFIKKWQGRAGGAEHANFQPFIIDFCAALGLPKPEPAEGGILSDYRFEAPASPDAAYSSKKSGRIDLYKRRCFILEAKQPPLADLTRAALTPEAPAAITVKTLFGEETIAAATARPKAPVRRYDTLMEAALAQAKGYALALPADHGWPPFLIICDVGRAFELYFDWAGNGKGYGFFPDQQRYRIELEALRLPDNQALLRGIWTDPRSVDPRLRAADVTRDIARRLAAVSKYLEKDATEKLTGRALAASRPLADHEHSLGIERTSMFLMRLLFCMFAEDVALLPPGKFEEFLGRARTATQRFWRDGLQDLWTNMGTAALPERYWANGDTFVRYFNGNLFADLDIYDLPPEQKGELYAAAKADWTKVEPAIFGTLLEQALTPAQRAQLGAHYTPRPYVERLVEATFMADLRTEWEALRNAPLPLREREGPAPEGHGRVRGPAPAEPTPTPDPAAIHAFHHKLAGLKILDPACGTGNFLCVAMELLLRLETEVIVLLDQLGQPAPPRIGPNQFLGLELNPRAAVIAELVLWIGWLRFRLANDPASITEPILPTLTNINFGRHGGYDALLAASDVDRVDLINPRAAEWPQADYIIGNPPFIGGKDLRSKLGLGITAAIWAAAPSIPRSADLVMHWWDRAATELRRPGTRLHRFGFVTTNSITQTFSRRVIEAHLCPSPATREREGPTPEGRGRVRATAPAAPQPLSLIFAIPDHPRTRASDKAAAVRIAMTVAEAGTHPGALHTVTSEAGLDSDEPHIQTSSITGPINADLTTGTDVTKAVPLKANDRLCSPGVKLHGDGFIVSPAEAAALGLGQREGLEAHIRPYRNGRDLLQNPRGVMVIDLFGLSEAQVRQRFPEVYQHLLVTVKPDRDANNRATYRTNWWIFGEPRREMRPALAGLSRYIATVETAKYRIFHFLSAEVLADNKIICVASDDAVVWGVLSSRIHEQWSLIAGGWLGFGNDPVYVKSKVFDPFPFPDATPAQRSTIAAIAEELDLTRRAGLAESPGLTMTGLYNLVEATRAGTLRAAQGAEASRARARIVAKLHPDLDAAVANAYGWPADRTPAQITVNRVALNAARAAEEATGQIRWLRPDYQAPISTN
ncbi:hypothetical protein GCM10007973_03110 [Polymorphobacter multimanifer]|uniref:DNA methyltransferase n=1 Tax=Polymorphobacter multimanifer TaxID=1070431 RepID=UPI001985A69C|nr:DNA methyltransferase [Polymorphobacter multimanifer]GGI69368.1 hypothetical protein GCM10007973_03110 [Polymorphobacter multimanifer]